MQPSLLAEPTYRNIKAADVAEIVEFAKIVESEAQGKATRAERPQLWQTQ